MLLAMGRSHAPGGISDPLMYLERFGTFGDEPHGVHLGYVTWGLSHALRAHWAGEHALSGDYLALLM
eukprot:4545621-Heterocapsa_arctica.AAC.1